jgi:hypothetical protein
VACGIGIADIGISLTDGMLRFIGPVLSTVVHVAGLHSPMQRTCWWG